MPPSYVLRDMALFVEVAKRRSFSQAAASLGMPISSLSRRITLFESNLGLRLLDRTTRKLVLTSYGEAYLAKATRLVEEAQRTYDDMLAEARGPSGFLKVTAPPDLWAMQHFASVVSMFSRTHEHIHLHVDLRPAPVDLAKDNYDLAVTTEEPKETSLIVRRVAAIANGLVASPDYLAAHGQPSHPSDLEGRHQAILPAQTTSMAWQLTRGKTETVHVTVTGSVSCNNQELARRFAIAGHGIAAADLTAMERDLSDNRLARVLPEWELPETPIYIVTTSRLLPAKARCFIDFVTRHLGATVMAAARPTASDTTSEVNRSPSGAAAHPVLPRRAQA